jgi:hypothetical protein
MPPITCWLFCARKIWIDEALGGAARCRRVALRQRGVAAFVIVGVDPQANRTFGPPPSLLRSPRSPKSLRPVCASDPPGGPFAPTIPFRLRPPSRHRPDFQMASRQLPCFQSTRSRVGAGRVMQNFPPVRQRDRLVKLAAEQHRHPLHMAAALLNDLSRVIALAHAGNYRRIW